MDSAQKAYILIVDDSPNNLTTLKACLKNLGQQIITANSAKEALRYVLQYDFAVILLDVQMPIMDGFEAARLIRSREKSSYTPIIFITALNKDEHDIVQGYEMGAVDYIFKPINPTILRSKVRVFVDLFTKSSLAINLQNELRERRHAEQRARRQQHQLELAKINRLSSMEEMTSALAHELNQPLTTISNYLNGCMRRLQNGIPQNEELIDVLQRTSKQAERAGAILHRIKNFVRKNKLYYEAVTINKLTMAISSLLQETIQDVGIELIFELSDQIPDHIMLDKIQIEQVLVNLLQNGIEALQNSNQLKKQLKIQTLLNPNQSITIIVKDNGPGITEEHLPRLFDLYFTTKEQGMGIGLSICRTIIEAHGGNIIAKNNTKDPGACFELTLPIRNKL